MLLLLHHLWQINPLLLRLLPRLLQIHKTDIFHLLVLPVLVVPILVPFGRLLLPNLINPLRLKSHPPHPAAPEILKHLVGGVLEIPLANALCNPVKLHLPVLPALQLRPVRFPAPPLRLGSSLVQSGPSCEVGATVKVDEPSEKPLCYALVVVTLPPNATGSGKHVGVEVVGQLLGYYTRSVEELELGRAGTRSLLEVPACDT
mmetsp:Transcript_11091/g.22743  ORF Transcript_11091/g.22743 Transcript_11091/m.22743 type:complete len:203 (-) Transcript_11091:660-1268(-)